MRAVFVCGFGAGYVRRPCAPAYVRDVPSAAGARDAGRTPAPRFELPRGPHPRASL